MAMVAVSACLLGCSGGLGHRSVGRTDGVIQVPPAVTSVRFELTDGGVEVRSSGATTREIRFRAVVRRAADTAVDLAALEAVGMELVVVEDPDRPGLAVVRGPRRPAAVAYGVLAFEAQLVVPADLALAIEIDGSGGIDVEDRTATTALRTHRGDLRLMRCTAAATLHTESGNTIVYDHSGDLDVEVGVGDMQVFARRPGRHLRLVTGAGNIQCLVPPDAGFAVEARTQTGKLANGFGFPIQRPSTYSAAMVGSRGDASTEIVMHTGTGHLSLSHKTFD